jgi:hypothetical protein
LEGRQIANPLEFDLHMGVVMAASPIESICEQLTEIKCPISGYVECYHWFERPDLRGHIDAFHPDYQSDPEPYFEYEAEEILKTHTSQTLDFDRGFNARHEAA